jgi:Tfp pilus assembly protein PilF
VLVVVAGWMAARWLRVEKAAPALAAAVVVALAWGTWERNVIYQSEERLWRDTIAKRPGNARAHMWLGSVFLRTDRPGEAVGEYEEALRLKPDYHEVVHPLGQALMSSGDTTAAEKFCDEQIAGNTPIAIDTRFLRGSIRMSRWDWAGAKEDLEVVVNKDPRAVAAHYSLGIALENLGELNEAQEAFKKTAAIDPNYRDVSMQLLRLGMGAGR